MLFNSHIFVFVFFPTAVTVFFILGRYRRDWAAGWLAVASVAFYAWGSPPQHVMVLLGSICINYAIGLRLVRSGAGTVESKLLLLAGLILNLSALAYFKYTMFAAGLLGWNIENILLPLGISFFTFTQVAFLVDAYRSLAKEYNPIHYLLFVTYFPHLIAGPILHHKEIMPQFSRPEVYRPDWQNISLGLSIFAVGLAKKVLLADSFAPYSDSVFSNAIFSPLTLAEAWIGALAYTLQIYYDFSGYCDMAIGISLVIGIRLPLNFNSPYKATSIIDFWRRWHMTLSRFLRDYLYVSLGGNRRGQVRRFANLMVVMLLGGLWHGAGWTFVIWGGLHGFYLVINHLWATMHIRLPNVLAWAFTFVAVIVAWVFFRSENIDTALAMLRAMAGGNGLSLPTALMLPLNPIASVVPGVDFKGLFNHGLFAPVEALIMIAIGLLWAVLAPNTQEVFGRFEVSLGHVERVSTNTMQFSPTLLWGTGIGMAMAIAIFMMSGDSPFLYFRF